MRFLGYYFKNSHLVALSRKGLKKPLCHAYLHIKVGAYMLNNKNRLLVIVAFYVIATPSVAQESSLGLIEVN
ncbi:MAG: hypothetical protein ACI845_001454, partial [Gammaproteobacteria bacterium]